MLVFPKNAEKNASTIEKGLIWAGYYVFNANISLTFQAIKNLYAHLTYLCFGPVCNFLGDF